MIPRRFFWLLDVLILGLAFLVAYSLLPSLLVVKDSLAESSPWVVFLFSAYTGPLPLPSLSAFAWVYVALVPPTLLFLELFGSYNPLLAVSRTRLALGSLAAPLLGLSIVTLALFALKSRDASRLFIFSFATLGSLGLCAYRLSLRAYFGRRQRAGYYTKNVVLVGLASGLEKVLQLLDGRRLGAEYRLLGYLGLCPDQPAPAVDGLTLPLLGEVQDLSRLLVHRPIHEVIVVYPTTGGEWLNQIIRDCDYFRVALHIVPEAMLMGELRDLRILYRSETLRLPAVVLQPPRLDSDAQFVKRVFDIVLSALLLVLLAPLFGLIALAIKLTTPHLSVFYPWRVVGQNGVEFTGYKFTTMIAEADERRAELLDRNEMSGPVFKMKDDPRVTPLGRFLRKYSLNELPQLWSVLKGDMSLIGPRPAFRHELERYELWHKRKLSIRPGITCLWQVRGRNAISNFDDWVRMDLEYIDNWSLWLDLKILAWTALAVLRGSGS